MVNKPRVGVIIRNTAKGSVSKNRSEEFDGLKTRYQTMTKLLKTLIQALRQRHTAMTQMDQARGAVTQALAAMAKDTPLATMAGNPSSEERSKMEDEAEEGTTTSSSYVCSQDSISTKSKARIEKFEMFAIDYTVQWEKTITTRINADIKNTEHLRREVDHYQTKTDQLKSNIAKAEEKGKSDPKSVDKLKRNEEKLEEARSLYIKASADLMLLMEETVDRSWRDLHPLLLKCIQFDLDMNSEDAGVLSEMEGTVSKLQEVAEVENLPPDDRLKELGVADPQTLSTRSETEIAANDEDDGNDVKKEEEQPGREEEETSTPVETNPF